MHADYVDAIIRAFHHQAASNPLFQQLKRSGLKAHCMAVCRDRFNARDEIVLRNFFGNADGQAGFLRAINRCSADRFRPLVDILRGVTVSPKPVYIELLAWMFDIRPRPYKENFDYTGVAVGNDDKKPEEVYPVTEGVSEWRVPGEPMLMGKGEGGVGTQLVKPEKAGRKQRAVLVALVLFVLGFSAFSFFSKQGNKIYQQSTGQCMYWSGDRYVNIDCGQKIKNATVLALDTELLNNFYRITRPETISMKSIGKVWYAKVDGEMEFYSAMGYHPVETHLQLKPITKYIIEKYILKEDVSNGSTQSALAVLKTGESNAFQSSPPGKVAARSFGVFGQCKGITLKHLRCSRNAKANGFCWQHQEQGQR